MLRERIAQIQELLEDEMSPWNPDIINKQIDEDKEFVAFTVRRLSYNDRILVKVPLDDFDTVPELLDEIKYKILSNPLSNWYKGLIVR